MQQSGTYELTMILGAATLMLWGVRMARTGVMRIYGAEIREILPRTLKNRFVALLAGAGSATILQSSIAVAVFTSTLAALGAVSVADGLVLMLGADAGSAVVAALLTLNLKAFWPMLMFTGYLLHSIYADSDSPAKQYGRILLGIAMILVALTFMSQVSSALAASDLIRIIVSSLGSELFIALLLFAILTWLAHSSIAILLFWASLVQAGITNDPALILAALLGINLGNALPPIVMTWNQAAPARRLVVGHGLLKLSGVFIGLVVLRPVAGLYDLLPGAPSFRVVILHIAFNLCLIILFGLFVRPIANLLGRCFVESQPLVEEIRPKYIPGRGEETGKPDLLPLTALSREVLRILGTVQGMLETTKGMLVARNAEQAPAVLKAEEKVNTLYKAVRAYTVTLTRQGLSEAEGRKATALLRYAASLENAADVICKTMIGIPEAMSKQDKHFSPQGLEEIDALFRYLDGNAQVAAEVIMTWSDESAGVLVQRKRDFRKMCHASSRRQIGRLTEDASNAQESTSAHFDLVSDMRWINTQLCGIAYEVLPESEQGDDDLSSFLTAQPE